MTRFLFFLVIATIFFGLIQIGKLESDKSNSLHNNNMESKTIRNIRNNPNNQNELKRKQDNLVGNQIFVPDLDKYIGDIEALDIHNPSEERKKEMATILDSFKNSRDYLKDKWKSELEENNNSCFQRVRICKLDCPLTERGGRSFSCLKECEKVCNDEL